MYNSGYTQKQSRQTHAYRVKVSVNEDFTKQLGIYKQIQNTNLHKNIEDG